MVIEHDSELELWPGEIGDPVREAIGNLLVTIIENTVAGSPERAKAMSEALGAHERIRAAMRDRQTLQ
jgi:hypothetical protein